VDTLDADDVTHGDGAPDALLSLMTAGKAIALEFCGAEDDAGQPMVIVETEAETFALTTEQSFELALVLAELARRQSLTSSEGRHLFDTLLAMVETINAVLSDLIGAGGETVH
jgi:mannitol-1-phosphate/altronate dehydrogenase